MSMIPSERELSVASEAGGSRASLDHGRRGSLLQRSALVQRILQTPAGGVVVITSAPGYGASTLMDLVGARTTDRQLKVRVHLDDPGALWASLASGLESSGTLRCRLAARPQELIAALAEGPDALILIDDVPEKLRADVRADLAEFLEFLPPTARAVLRTHRSSSLDMSRLLTHGRVTLLGQPDLTLTRQESSEYVRERAPHLSRDAMDRLLESTEGWVGALAAAMTAGLSAEPDDPERWLRSTGLGLLFGPLQESLPPGSWEMLVRASVLERLDPAACAAVAGTADAAVVLADLADRMVVTRLASPHTSSYRVHGLLRAYLSAQLALRGREAVHAAHKAASTHHSESGDVEAAITHLLECGDSGEARRLLARHAEPLLARGSAAGVSHWYRAMPPQDLAREQLHLLAATWADLLRGDLASADANQLQLKASIEEAGPAPDPPEGADLAGADALAFLKSEWRLLDAYTHTWRGHLNVAVDQLRQVVASYEGEWSRSAHQFAPVLMARVLVWQGQTSMVSKRLDAMATRPNTLPTYRLVQIPALRAYLALSEGRVLRAHKMATEALAALDQLGHIGVIDACDAHLVLAGADRELENLDEARGHAEYVVDRATQFGHVTLAVLGRCELARTAAAQGDRQRTMAELDQARRLGAANDVSPSLLRHISRAEVDVALEWGDVARVHRALQPLATSEAYPILAMRATVLDNPPSEGDVRAMLGRFPPTSPRQQVESHFLLVAALGGNRPAEASSHLEAALRIAVEHGILSALRGRGSLVLRLAEQLEVPGSAHDLKQILEAGDRARRNRRARTLPPLSQGEVVILERIVAGHGNRELAAELGISVNTVKTRIRRLYRKLGVTDRASLLSLLSQGP